MLTKNELGLIQANHEDALHHDQEHGGPIALMLCVHDVPQLLAEVERLQGLVTTLRQAAWKAQLALESEVGEASEEELVAFRQAIYQAR